MNKKYVKRGAILRAMSGPTKGDYYLFVRTMGGQDKTFDFLGNEIPGMHGMTSYAYKLVNITDVGKARQTEVERQFITSDDGVTWRIPLDKLVAHYGIDLVDVTDVSEIKVNVKEILDNKFVEAQAQQHVLDMGQVFLSLFNNVNIRPVPGGVVFCTAMHQ